MNENESQRIFTINKDEFLVDPSEIDLGSLEEGNFEIIKKYEERLEKVEIENNHLKEKIRETLRDDA